MDQRWRFEQETRGRPEGENEDAVFCAPVAQGNLLFAAVADGVGGRPGGAWASQRAVQLAVRRARTVRGADALDPGVWRMALEDLHTRLGRERDGATTLTVLITDGHRWAAAWVGDTRLYRITATGVENLSDTNERTGYLGGDDSPIARGRSGEVQPGEKLALLSDGIWKYVPGEAFRALLATDGGKVVTGLLAEVARRNGGKLVDDATGVVIDILERAPVAAPAPVTAEDEVLWVEEVEPQEEHLVLESMDSAVIGDPVSIREVLGDEMARRPGNAGRVQRASEKRSPTLKERASPIGRLGLDPLAVERLEEVLNGRSGLVVLAGAAGAGKTATGYALAEMVSRNAATAASSGTDVARVVVSVEAPLEKVVPGLVQVNCEWNDLEKQLRAAAERADLGALHGKIEWYEMGLVMLRVAEAGRLALGALPVETSAQAIERLLSMGLDAERLAKSLRVVHTQRLLPRLCVACREPSVLDDVERRQLGLDDALKERLRLGFIELDAARIYRPRGCRTCKDTGYSQISGHASRVVASETLRVSEPVRDAIRRGSTARELDGLARSEGMWSLRESALRRVLLGETTLEEFEKVFR